MIMDNNQVKCELCKYFEARNRFCRRHPPVPVVVEKNGFQVISAKFPVISQIDVDYCHEFSAKII